MKYTYLILIVLFFSARSLVFGQIAGANGVCVGSVYEFKDFPPGLWSSSNTAVATIGSLSGIVSGVAPGTTTLTFFFAGVNKTKTFTIGNTFPNTQTLAFTGTGSICSGSPGSDLQLAGSDTWVSYKLMKGGIAIGNPVNGTGGIIDFGLQTTAGSGYYVLGYTNITGCLDTVGSTPTGLLQGVKTINGLTSTVCVGSATNLSDSVIGGTWQSSDGPVASITTNTGVVTGMSAGSAIITYKLASGCITTTTLSIINTTPSITGPPSVCQGATIQLNAGNGTWASSDTTIAKVDSRMGIVTGVSVGTTIITFSSFGSCGSATTVINVNTLPAP